MVFENVSFSYAKDPNKECLKNVNLTVKSGETVEHGSCLMTIV